jgi:hypothetical protein
MDSVVLFEREITGRETSSASCPPKAEIPADPNASDLVQTVAGEAAQLLIEAAEARELAMMMKAAPTAGDLLKSATALEQRAASWEKRLGWWRRLRQRDGGRCA